MQKNALRQRFENRYQWSFFGILFRVRQRKRYLTHRRQVRVSPARVYVTEDNNGHAVRPQPAEMNTNIFRGPRGLIIIFRYRFSFQKPIKDVEQSPSLSISLQKIDVLPHTKNNCRPQNAEYTGMTCPFFYYLWVRVNGAVAIMFGKIFFSRKLSRHFTATKTCRARQPIAVIIRVSLITRGFLNVKLRKLKIRFAFVQRRIRPEDNNTFPNGFHQHVRTTVSTYFRQAFSWEISKKN